MVLLLVRYSFRNSGAVCVERGDATRFLTEARPQDEALIDNE